MYGQNQYGYQGSYQPQNTQPAYRPAQPVKLSSVDDLLTGNGAKAYFTADSRPGDSVTGVIESIETTQVNDFQTKQPAFWNDGKPKEQIHIIIQTQLRDPSVDDDDGRRSLWIKGWGVQLNALRTACKQLGRKPEPGDTITETYVGLGQRGNAPQPPKLYEFHIKPADRTSDLLNPQNGPQAGLRQQPRQDYPQQQYAPQQGTQAPNPGYQPAPADPWNTQPQQGVQLAPQHAAGPDPMKVQQLKALGKPPQEIAGLLGVPVEAVTAITDQAQPQNHGSEDGPDSF